MQTGLEHFHVEGLELVQCSKAMMKSTLLLMLLDLRLDYLLNVPLQHACIDLTKVTE